jgi:hypothetical protein
MDNLIFTEIEMMANHSSSGDLYVKTFVLLKAKSKTDDKIIEMKLPAYTKVDYSAFQYVGIVNNWIKMKDNKPYIHIKDVETRLYKGINRFNNEFHMLKCFIDSTLVVSVFLDEHEVLIMENYMELNAEFSEATKGIHEFKFKPTVA